MKSYKNAGDEPSWDNSMLTESQLGSAFSWYNEHFNKKDIYDSTIDDLEKYWEIHIYLPLEQFHI